MGCEGRLQSSVASLTHNNALGVLFDLGLGADDAGHRAVQDGRVRPCVLDSCSQTLGASQ